MTTDLTVFREYEPHECGPDDYPLVWHSDVKHLVRADAGHRCIRCRHPYVVGASAVWDDDGMAPPSAGAPITPALFDALGDDVEALAVGKTLWSPCDELCEHGGPIRWRGASSTRRWMTGRDDIAAVMHLAGNPDIAVQAAWRILTVHHLNGRKHDLRWWNLAALCQRCHLLIQRKVIMERIYPFEHTEWFKAHAAGYYALCYEGRSITREEAEDRQDELLGLERMA